MTQSSFAWDGRKIDSIEGFKEYLATLKAPYWLKGVTVHHSYIPDQKTWHGQKTVDGMKDYYKNRVQWRDSRGQIQYGWSAGPHLFLAPDNAHWIGTPLNQQGIHAGAFNSSFIGIENIGNFDISAPDEAVRKRCIDAIVAIFQWKGIQTASIDTVRGHRECGSSKSCPGSKWDMNQFRRDLGVALHNATMPVSGIQRWQITREPCPVRISRDIRASKALGNTAQLPIGQIVDVDDVTDGWLHLAASNPFRDLGFIQVEHATRLS